MAFVVCILPLFVGDSYRAFPLWEESSFPLWVYERICLGSSMGFLKGMQAFPELNYFAFCEMGNWLCFSGNKPVIWHLEVRSLSLSYVQGGFRCEQKSVAMVIKE